MTTPQYEPSGMTAFIIVNEDDDKLILIDNIKKTIESCQGTLIDQWILIGGDETLPLVTGASYYAINLQEAIEFQSEKNKWAIILNPGEVFSGAMDQMLVCIYGQSDYNVVSLVVKKKEKMIRSLRLIKKGVNPNELYNYDYIHFLALNETTEAYISDESKT